MAARASIPITILEQDPDCTCENPTAGATLRCDTAANNEGYAVFTRVIRSLGEQ